MEQEPGDLITALAVTRVLLRKLENAGAASDLGDDQLLDRLRVLQRDLVARLHSLTADR